MKHIAFTLSALTLAAAPAFAETTLVDTDENGSYSMEEMLVVYPDLSEADFITMDTDASGEISIEELADAQTKGLLPSME